MLIYPTEYVDKSTLPGWYGVEFTNSDVERLNAQRATPTFKQSPRVNLQLNEGLKLPINKKEK